VHRFGPFGVPVGFSDCALHHIVHRADLGNQDGLVSGVAMYIPKSVVALIVFFIVAMFAAEQDRKDGGHMNLIFWVMSSILTVGVIGLLHLLGLE